MKNTKHTPTPSAGAIRAAKKLSPYKNEMEINAVALIIDQETGHDELLAALKEMVSQFGKGDGHDSQNMADVNAISLARSAIAKAESQ